MTAPNGFRHLPAYFDRSFQARLLAVVRKVVKAAPFFVPAMPKTGKPFSVLMTNCGPLGWVSDKDGGYRYQPRHPVTDAPWPAMPRVLLALWRDVTGYGDAPEACLINRYAPGAKMGLHVDRDEENFDAPVVSVSLGDDAWFRIGGLSRRDSTERLLLKSGDVVILAGAARLAYHGIDRIVPGTCDLLGEQGRINLTLRRVTPATAGVVRAVKSARPRQ